VAVHKCPTERDVSNYTSACAEAITKLNAARDSHPSTKDSARKGAYKAPAPASGEMFKLIGVDELSGVHATWEQLCMPLSNARDALRKVSRTGNTGNEAKEAMLYAGLESCLKSTTVRLHALARGEPFPLQVKLDGTDESLKESEDENHADRHGSSTASVADLSWGLKRECVTERCKAKHLTPPVSVASETSNKTGTSGEYGEMHQEMHRGNGALKCFKGVARLGRSTCPSPPKFPRGDRGFKKMIFVSHFSHYTKLQHRSVVHLQKIVRGYNARRRVHGLSATLEQEKSWKVRMIEAIQESGLLQGAEYSDAQVKNTIIIQTWFRGFLKKMQARVKFKRGASRLHNVQGGIFEVQQEVHTRLLLSSLQVSMRVTVEASNSSLSLPDADPQPFHPLSVMEETMKHKISGGIAPLAVTRQGLEVWAAEPLQPHVRAALGRALPYSRHLLLESPLCSDLI
jgi:hypothetical protein